MASISGKWTPSMTFGHRVVSLNAATPHTCALLLGVDWHHTLPGTLGRALAAASGHERHRDAGYEPTASPCNSRHNKQLGLATGANRLFADASQARRYA